MLQWLILSKAEECVKEFSDIRMVNYMSGCDVTVMLSNTAVDVLPSTLKVCGLSDVSLQAWIVLYAKRT